MMKIYEGVSWTNKFCSLGGTLSHVRSSLASTKLVLHADRLTFATIALLEWAGHRAIPTVRATLCTLPGRDEWWKDVERVDLSTPCKARFLCRHQ